MRIFCKHSVALFLLLIATFTSLISQGHPDKIKVDSIKSLVQKLSSDTAKINTLIDIASGMSVTDSNNKIIIATEARNLAEKIKWRQGIYNANRKLGEIYFSCHKNNNKAFEAFENNIKLAESVSDTLNLTISYECIAKIYQKSGQYQNALEYYNRILSLTRNTDMQMGVLADMGVVYSDIGDFSHALSSYRSSLALLDAASKSKNNIKDLQDTIQTAGLQLNIGDIYIAMAQPDNAINNYEKVLALSVAIKDMYFQIAGAAGIGKTFQLKNNYQKSIEYYLTALSRCREINDFEDEIRILNELAITYLDTNEFAKAIAYADSSLRLAEEQHILYLPTKSFTILGNIYVKQKKYGPAIQILKKALDISRTNNLAEDERDAWLSLSNAYEGSGQYKEAKEAFRQYFAVRENILNSSKENQLMLKDVEADFRSKKIIDSLRQVTEYENMASEKKRYAYVGFSSLLFGSLFVFLVFRNYSARKKYKQLLSGTKH
jgi:tetratricopeptide (TPR) repeat protein